MARRTSTAELETEPWRGISLDPHEYLLSIFKKNAIWNARMRRRTVSWRGRSGSPSSALASTLIW